MDHKEKGQVKVKEDFKEWDLKNRAFIKDKDFKDSGLKGHVIQVGKDLVIQGFKAKQEIFHLECNDKVYNVIAVNKFAKESEEERPDF